MKLDPVLSQIALIADDGEASMVEPDTKYIHSVTFLDNAKWV